MSQAPEDDDERTIVRPSPGKGGQRDADVQLGHTLPNGTRIRDYEITGLIGEGGFGIVYLAYDHSLQRSVAIKEYMPSSMASRVNASAMVMVKSDRHQETFKAGLKSFVNEARLLARFDHPALVKVYRFWEENGTAYMVMPFYEGPTLKSALASMGKAPDEAALRAWLHPLLDALGVMHAAQCYHRDIAPDNILLTATGPLLLDFGAARRVIGDMTHALTVVLKPGYAPIEQYGDVATMAQGAWTDLYALACVVYFAITGKVPMSSVERLMDDRLEPLAKLAAGRYSPGLLRAVDAALAVRPQDRPQTDAQFRAMFDPPGATPRSAPPASPDVRAAPAAPEPTSDPATRVVSDPATRVVSVRRSAPQAPPVRTEPSTPPSTPTAPAEATVPRPPPMPPSAPTASPAARPATRRTAGYLVGAAVCAIAVAAGALYFIGGRRSSAPQGVATSASGPAGPIAAAASAPPRVADTPKAAPSPATPLPAAPAATMTTPAPAPPPDPFVVESPRPAHATAPSPDSVAQPVPTAPVRTVPIATNESSASVPTTREPAAESRPARARREPPARLESSPAPPKPVPSRNSGVQSRCSDILQKASLEPLTAEEAAFLKGECR